MQMRVGRLIAAVASVALALFAWPAHAEPAMWVVKDADTTLYLLGTIHITKPGMNWRSDKIDGALEASDEFWMEASVDSDPAMLRDLIIKHGLDRRPLSSKLSGEDWARVQSAAKTVGVPIASVEQMRPWLAALSLSLKPVMKEDGYDLKQGVDRVLEASARVARKTVKTFETMEQQLQIFSSLSEESEVALLTQTLDELAVSSGVVDQLADAWLAGDVSALEAKSVELKTKAPELYDLVFVRRNLDWCDQIAGIMKGAGTSFVAVGAGHLVGDQSVPAILTQRGFTVTPY